ncbi:MAG: helix-turn-helix domain-containing protein [Deltaproteobacteria bacterium]|nr:helix-turn-helix domain-containing protein [Deltaproteobacteria bacterium]MBW1954434.1 helix-turn-helix domain-containing protein [Deltaproteobacteria bacterium]MBW2041466.1 helix-turn-helix domain-containing protein [Deltaproteobacteria bacterium]MBW2131643.1 helix-turn-helix domain-containing protein [Deltaproteobacteria bacterium]
MQLARKPLTVSQAAAICGVNRNTIGFWIRSKKLRAHRVGRNYAIPVEELALFLKSTGQPVPTALGGKALRGPFFRSMQKCWEFLKRTDHAEDFRDCAIFKNELEPCFTGKEASTFGCKNSCHECQYYLEVYHSRIQFIYQIAYPAAVGKDLFFWGVNDEWARLCGTAPKEMVGKGIEQVYHPDSLGMVISNHKKRALKEPFAPRTETVYIRTADLRKKKLSVAHYLLNEPAGAWLLLAEPFP